MRLLISIYVLSDSPSLIVIYINVLNKIILNGCNFCYALRSSSLYESFGRSHCSKTSVFNYRLNFFFLHIVFDRRFANKALRLHKTYNCLSSVSLFLGRPPHETDELADNSLSPFVRVAHKRPSPTDGPPSHLYRNMLV